MNIIGNKNSCIYINNNIISINNKNYQLPKGVNFNNISVINGSVSIKGYILKDDKFIKNSSNLMSKIKKILFCDNL